MNFTPAQALWSATAGGAAALRRSDIGVLARGPPRRLRAPRCAVLPAPGLPSRCAAGARCRQGDLNEWSHNRGYRNGQCGHRPGQHRRRRAGRPRRRRGEGVRRIACGDRQEPDPHRGVGRRDQTGVRRLHGLRRACHPSHSARDANPAAAQPDSLACRGVGCRGRTRGRPGDDAAAAVHARDRPHRCAPGGRAGLCGHAVGRADPRRLRVRQPRLLRGPGPAGAHRAGRDRRRPGAHRRRRTAAVRGGARPARAHAGGARREGGPGTDQRHRRDARHADPGAARPGRTAQARRHRRRDERRGAARQ